MDVTIDVVDFISSAGAHVADIFISYSKKHRELTERLAQALKREGYSVWWDHELEVYATFRDQIDAALSNARVIVVIWSDGAAANDYVIAEAREALLKARLVNTLAPGFDPNKIPKPFGEYQAEKVENIDAVMRGIARLWTGERPSRLDAAGFYERATGRPALSSKQEKIPLATYVTPARLLNARVVLTPYLDVHGLREAMVKWATQGRPLHGRLVHGPGGVGKTRLMAELCADLRDRGWAAGFVEAPPAKDADIHRQAIEHLIDSDQTAGLLLVLDYAERRQEEAAGWSEVMARAAVKRPSRRLRLVLLARSAGEWWQRGVDETPALQAVFGGGGSLVEVTPFAEEAERCRLLADAAAAFREVIARVRASDPDAFAELGELTGRPIPARLQAQLAQEAYARPLMIQVAALLHLYGEVPDNASVARLLDAIVGVERRYWRTSLGAACSDARLTAVSRATIQITLAGGVERPEAEALLLKDPYFGRRAPIDAEEPLGDLDRLFRDGAGRLMALEPDLVGEHLVTMDADQRLVDACLDWAGDSIERRRAILTVLNRATRDEHGPGADRAKAPLERTVRERGASLAPDLIVVALDTPGELPNVLEHAAEGLDPVATENLLAAIPMRTVRLARPALPLAERSVDFAREAAEGDADDGALGRLATALGRLGTRLSGLGRREEALNPTAEAVEIRRELTARNRVVLPRLAVSLDDLGIRLSDLGRGEEALTAAAEAVQIFRELASQNRDAFLSYLAGALTNLGLYLSNLGRRDEALSAGVEAVAIKRELALQNRNAFLPGLAGALTSLGLYLTNLGRREEALSAQAEALAISRELALQNRDAFLPDLAASLTNVGACLSRLGCREETVQASAEAVAIRRELAGQNRGAFLPDLASSLHNLANRLFEAGRREDALNAGAEAVEIHRELASQTPDAFLPDLATSLNNHGRLLSGVGRREDALTAAAEAVKIRRQLVARSRDAYLPSLAVSLSNLGNRLSDLGRRDDALTAGAEALGIHRELASQNPAAFLPDLALSLSNEGNRLSELGRYEEALDAGVEGLLIYRGLVAQNRDAFLPGLASLLNNLGNFFSAVGRRAEALASNTEAVDLGRDLVAQNRGAYLPDLASSLHNLANRLFEVGRYEQALKACAEGVEMYRELAAQNRGAFLPNLASLLNNQGEFQQRLFRHDEALKVAAEAVDLYRELVSQNDVFLSGLARSLNNLKVRLLNVGRQDEAQKAGAEAAEVSRRLSS